MNIKNVKHAKNRADFSKKKKKREERPGFHMARPGSKTQRKSGTEINIAFSLLLLSRILRKGALGGNALNHTSSSQKLFHRKMVL